MSSVLVFAGWKTLNFGGGGRMTPRTPECLERAVREISAVGGATFAPWGTAVVPELRSPS